MNRNVALALFALLFVAACTRAHQPQPPTPGDDGPDGPVAAIEAPGWREAPEGSVSHYAAPPPQLATQPSAEPEEAGTPRDLAPLGNRAAKQPAPHYRNDAPSAAPDLGYEAPRASRGGGGGFEDKGMGSAPAAKSGKPSYDALGDARSESRPRASAQRPRQEERPGLGTSWGETRHSEVTQTYFERDGSSPSYSGALNYNDEQGAYALAARDGRVRSSRAELGLGGAVTVSLVDESGRTMRAYRGGGRTVAVGGHGDRYSIFVQNHTNERFEIVLSVDGLDVLDGRDAGYGKRGYLLDAYGTLEIEGFRQTDDAVAAFRFGRVSQSYAAQTGSARNVGVIGVAAFGERGYSARLRAYQERIYALRAQGYEVERRQSADPFPRGYAAPPLQLVR